jgi:virginiamycin B lyase
VSNYRDPSINEPPNITSGPDGALWFTNQNNSFIGRITTSGVVSHFSVGGGTFGITAGPDGALWFTIFVARSIERITTSGVVTDYTSPTIIAPLDITTGPDGALWFTNFFQPGSIGRLKPF